MGVAAPLTGLAAEQAAADYLVVAGYTILFRNRRLGHLELDIVARKGGTVAVVEVRKRGANAYERPLESLSPRKRDRIRQATERLWRELKADPTIERIRIDVAAVTEDAGGVQVEYFEAAF